MKLDVLFSLLREAQHLCGHADFVVIGSLSILALEAELDIPDDMTMSNDVACYTRAGPGRVFDLSPQLGEHSPFHQASGIYLDAVSPDLPSLPDGWEQRLGRVERDGLRAWFLDPNDAAVSKYARGEPRDGRWIRAGIRAGVVSLPTVKSRLKTTGFVDDDEAARAKALVDADLAWFATLRSASPTREPEDR